MPRLTPRPHRMAVAVGVLAASLFAAAGCTPEQPTEPAPPPAPPSTSAAAPSPSVTPTPTPTPTTPAPTPAGNPLNGGRPNSNGVFAVKVENTAAARPQIGLNAADIVVVEEVEAGITRLIAIYNSTLPTKVGPVRSARNTDVGFLPMWGKPGLVYSGANRLVQENIRGSRLIPIERSDRDNSRSAPHNVMVNLQSLAQANGGVGKARDIGWRFAATDPMWDAAPAGANATSQVGSDTFTFTHGAKGYVIRWRGQTYNDGSTGDQTADNVVVLSVQNRADTDSTSSISVVSETTGSGRVAIYRDGKTLTGTWSRASKSAPMSLKDASGKDIPLKPGRTWMTLQG